MLALWLLMACTGSESLGDTEADTEPVTNAQGCTLQSELPDFAGACQTQYAVRESRGFMDVSGTEQARCDTFDWDYQARDHAIVLSDDVDDYPLVVRIDPQGFASPCTTCDNAEGVETTYGLALAVPDSLLDNPRRTAVIQVDAPWRVVSGGTGKAGSWPCLSGYQEFGAPLACQNNPFGDFGIATDDPDAGPVDVWVTIDPILDEWNCCPYVCGG